MGAAIGFANGLVVRELLVSSDEETRRLAFTAVDGPATHHNASFQVFDHGQGETRLVWITDVLPHEVGEPVRALIDHGAVVLKATLEGAAAS